MGSGLTVFVAIAATACSGHGVQLKPASSLEMHYRLWNQRAALEAQSSPTLATHVYRDILAKSMSSNCKMLPHDSEYFDRISKRCSTLQAVLYSAARLLLERAATTDYLQPVRFGAQLKWIDWDYDLPCRF